MARLLFAVAEERLTRAKHDARFPVSQRSGHAWNLPASKLQISITFVLDGSRPAAAYLHDLRDYFSGKRSLWL